MSRRSALFTVVAAGVVCLLAGRPAQAAAHPVSHSRTRIKSVTVPMVLLDNRPHVTLSIAGPKGKRTQARFIVDTGGGAFVVSQALADEVGWKENGPARKQGGASFAPFHPRRVFLGRMRLDLKHVRASILEGSRTVYPGDPADGVLPAQVLARYDVAFDYPDRRFTIAPPGTLKHYGMRERCRISPDLRFPSIMCKVRGRAYHFLLDTGGSYCMASRRVLEKWLKTDRHMRHETGAAGPAGMTGTATDTKALVVRIPHLNWVGFYVKGAGAVSRPTDTYERWVSRMTAEPVIGSLSGNVLRDFRFEIDYAHGMIYVQRLRDTRRDDMDRVGLVLKMDSGGRYEIAGTCSDAGRRLSRTVRKGDRLEAVDGTRITGLPRARVDRLLAGRPGNWKRLLLLRDGHRLRVKARISRLT